MNRARRFTFGGLAVAVAALVANGSAILPAAADPPTQWVDAGTLTLSTQGADRVTFDDLTQPDDVPDLTQTLGTEPSCNLATSGDLLRFTGKAGSVTKPVGFLNESIGVNEKLPDWCNKVDTFSAYGAETLELSLGSKLVNFADPPRRLLATAASLDLEVRSYLGFKAKIQATAWLDSVDSAGHVSSVSVATAVLQQGSDACKAKDNENCRLNISAPPDRRFNRLVLKVVKDYVFKGSFSLEGGSDTQTAPLLPPIGPSTFTLASEVDTFFNCTEGQTLTEGNVSVTYVGNGDGEPCEGFGVVLTAGDQEIHIRKPLSLTPDAQFIFDVDWSVPNPDQTPEVTLRQPQIDFEVDPENPNFIDMPFCPDSLYDSSGALVGVQVGDPSELLAEFDMVPEAILEDTQFACVGAPRSAEAGPDAVTVHDRIFLIGDARMRY